MNFNIGQELTLNDVFIRLLISTVLGMIIGINREINNKAAGLKTHCLVIIGATVIAIIERFYIFEVVTLNNPTVAISVGRFTVGVITGIGFLGAGTISLKENSTPEGLTTAASIWCTACLGLAVGMGYYWIAIIALIFIMIVLTLVSKIIFLIRNK